VGARYAAAAPLLRMLLAGVLFTACALVLDTYFLNQLRRPGLLSLLSVGQVAVVAGLGVLLIPRFAASGAAASLTLAEILGALSYACWHLRASGSTVRDLVVLNDADRQALRRHADLLLSRRRDG
jgi:O-antigen/teichoic acid export membrane protein